MKHTKTLSKEAPAVAMMMGLLSKGASSGMWNLMSTVKGSVLS